MHYVTMGTKQHDVIIMSTHTFVVNTKVHMYKEWKTYVQGMENICKRDGKHMYEGWKHMYKGWRTYF